MSGALIMVWLGTAASQRVHEPDLDGWARSRERQVAAPRTESELPAARHDDTAAERVEALLAEARTETYSSDASAVESALDSAEARLLEHPELPESAWLMAEIVRQRAIIVAPRDPQAAALDERRAVELGGPRATPFVASAPRSSRAGTPAVAAPTGTTVDDAGTPTAGAVALDGPLPTDEVDVDGARVSAPRTIHDGSHHVRVLRRARLAWSGWVTVAGADVHLAVAAPLACSTADLSPASLADASPVLCDDYAKARDAGPRRIEVATCSRGVCGPWLPWSRSWGAEFEGPMHSPPKPHPVSLWVPLTLAGVAAVIVGGFVLAEEGVFERHGPARTTFTFQPPR
ncbi:MAG TPA: hypothetical protein VH062_04360 [Polyangiaceae bacterium]|nr:hypothetical protein [Polyangiaceae bacterium]